MNEVKLGCWNEEGEFGGMIQQGGDEKNVEGNPVDSYARSKEAPPLRCQPERTTSRYKAHVRKKPPPCCQPEKDHAAVRTRRLTSRETGGLLRSEVRP